MTRVARWAPPLLYMAIIFYVSSQSNPLPAVTARVWDKLLHASEYAVLGALLARALGGEGLGIRAMVVTTILLASAYGATDEYHQSKVPQRQPDVADWMVDTFGASIGALAWAVRFRGTTGRVRGQGA
jgi:VanZ family protein